MQPLLTVREVAKLLHISLSATYRLIYSHRLPSVNVGVRRCIRVRPEDLEAFLAENRAAALKADSLPLKHLKGR